MVDLAHVQNMMRIKNNVRKMVEQGAPEADIDGYISTENTTVDAVRAFGKQGHDAPEYIPPGQREYGRAESAASGAADATTFGFGDELASYPASLISGVPRQQVLDEMRSNAQQAQEQNPGSYLAGQVGGGLAQAAATGGAGFGTMAARSGAGLGKVALGSALDGAVYSGVYGAGSSDGDLEDRAAGGATGAVLGGAVGFAAPYLTSAVSSVARKAITPFESDTARMAALNVLEREGVPLTAGQKTGSKALRYAESEIGGNRAAQITEDQGRAFTDAALRKAGASGLADPDNLAALKGHLGAGFDQISARNTLQADGTFMRDFVGTIREYNRVLPTEQKVILGNIANDIGKRIQSGKGRLTGEDYQMYRSRLTKRAKNARGSDNELADAYRGLRNALDSAMDRSINPADAGEWAKLRRNYGNYKVLNKASLGGGEDAGLGIISPARLRMAASSGNTDAFATGASDFTDLAKAGQAVMTPLPNSGTAGRLRVQNLGAMAPSLVGASAGGAYGAQDGGGIGGAITGALAGLVAPRAIGRMMMSKGGQKYLANQIMRTNLPSEEKKALVTALIRGATIPAIEGH